MATGDEKFRCVVDGAVHAEVLHVWSHKKNGDKKMTKNQAVRFLVETALKNSAKKASLPPSGQSEDCSMIAEKGFFETTLDYRNRRSIPPQKTVFLRDAVTLGAFIYKQEHN